MSTFRKAIEAIGSQNAAAKILGITQSGLWRAVSTGKCPANLVLRVEELSGVSRHELRPDIFGPAPAKQASCRTPPAGKPTRDVRAR